MARRLALVGAIAAAAWLAPNASAADFNLLAPGTVTFDGGPVDEQAGHSVAPAGDINNDGLEDVIIGGPGAAYNGGDSGSAYVIYGAPNRSSITLSGGLGAQGFRIDGAQGIDAAGISVDGAGDFNGDGIDDVIVGAFLANPNVNEGGAAYVIYGRNEADPANLNLADLEGADPASRGFVIETDLEEALLGASVAGVGFFNSDSIADVAVGGVIDVPSGTEAVYVVYGQDNAANDDPSDVNVDSLGLIEPLGQASRGMIIAGEGTSIGVGQSLAGVGDTAGDAQSDLAIGASGYDCGNCVGGVRTDAGQVYVAYGENTADPADVDLAEIYEGVPGGADEDRGYAVAGATAGDQFGASVGSLGDFNGQGRPDWIGGAPSFDVPAEADAGAAYIVTGASVIDPTFDPDLNDMSPAALAVWSRIDGTDCCDELGTSVAEAGDVNGDGIADAVVGAREADPVSTNFHDGAAYVVYGQSAADPADVSAANIRNGGTFDTRGFAVFRNHSMMDTGMLGSAVATAGDVDGDGRSELLVSDDAFLGNKGIVFILESLSPVTVSPGSHPFGELTVGEQSAVRQLTLTNVDNEGNIRVNFVSLIGADAAHFTLADVNCVANSPLSPGESCTVDARFVPGSGGAKQAVVRFGDTGDGAPHEVALSGTGVFNPPDTSISGATQTDANPTFTFSSPTPGATFECSFDLGAFAACSSPLTLTGVASGLHVLTVRAVANGLTDASPAEHYFFVSDGGPPPDPVQGETTNLDPVSGKVTVDIPGDGRGPIPIEEAVQVPVGTKVDTTNGRVELTSDKKGTGTQSAEFYAGVFVIRQGKRSDETIARLRGAQQCGPGTAKEPFASRKRKPKLWGSGSGNFASQGNHATASVRGTTWLIFEQCGGITGTQVKKGVVSFRNHYTGSTTLVRAPGTALAQPIRPQPPASAK